jgi:hypothetical protein
MVNATLAPNLAALSVSCNLRKWKPSLVNIPAQVEAVARRLRSLDFARDFGARQAKTGLECGHPPPCLKIKLTAMFGGLDDERAI